MSNFQSSFGFILQFSCVIVKLILSVSSVATLQNLKFHLQSMNNAFQCAFAFEIFEVTSRHFHFLLSILLDQEQARNEPRLLQKF